MLNQLKALSRNYFLKKLLNFADSSTKNINFLYNVKLIHLIIFQQEREEFD